LNMFGYVGGGDPLARIDLKGLVHEGIPHSNGDFMAAAGYF